MKKIIKSFIFGATLSTYIMADDFINVNFKDLSIKQLIQITSKAVEKNILITQNIEGKIDFISNQPITKSQLYDILLDTLKLNGYTLIDKNGILIVKKVEKTVEKSTENKLTDVVYLKNTDVKNVSKIIQGIIEQKQYNQYNKPFVSIDVESNSIILMGMAKDIKYFKELIEKLDVDKQQVYVEAKIIELSEQKATNMGIKYGIEGLKNGGSSALTFAGNLGGSSIALSSDVLSKVDIPKLSDGLILGASINLMKQNYALDVVSEPSILCINNKESSIYVGETRSVASGTTVGTTTTTNYKREDIGLKLKVKPRISTGNKVTLQIETILEDVTQTDQTSGQPNTNKKEVFTTAIVNNGESVILGGLIKNKTENSLDKVPLLGDIPLIGGLFRNDSTLNDKINLIVIVTPYIIPKSKDLSYVREQLTQLKILEQKYTKDLALRLEKMRVDTKSEDFIREKEMSRLKAIDENIQNNKEGEIIKGDKNLILHKKRLKETFGIEM